MVNIAKLKQDYVKYYEDVPVQKYAAKFIGRDEDTIIRWKKTDAVFADAVQRAKLANGWLLTQRAIGLLEASFCVSLLGARTSGSNHELKLAQK